MKVVKFNKLVREASRNGFFNFRYILNLLQKSLDRYSGSTSTEEELPNIQPLLHMMTDPAKGLKSDGRPRPNRVADFILALGQFAKINHHIYFHLNDLKALNKMIITIFEEDEISDEIVLKILQGLCLLTKYNRIKHLAIDLYAQAQMNSHLVFYTDDDRTNFSELEKNIYPIAILLNHGVFRIFSRSYIDLSRKLINLMFEKQPFTDGFVRALYSLALIDFDCRKLAKTSIFDRERTNKITSLITDATFQDLITNANDIELTQLATSLSYLLANNIITPDLATPLLDQIKNKRIEKEKSIAARKITTSLEQRTTLKILRELYPEETYHAEMEVLTKAGYTADIVITNRENKEQVIVEVSGQVHNQTRDTFRNDLLRKTGFKDVITIHNDEVNEFASFKRLLRDRLETSMPIPKQSRRKENLGEKKECTSSNPYALLSGGRRRKKKKHKKKKKSATSSKTTTPNGTK